MSERQLTNDSQGHQLHNTGVFSADDRWIVFDNREDDTLLGRNPTIGMVDVESGEMVELYRSAQQTIDGPGVGAASWHPRQQAVLFIHGLRCCDAARPYSATRRSGVAVDIARPGEAIFLDARDTVAPFTAGALRGGTHAHSWNSSGEAISFTYNDDVLLGAGLDRRCVGVMMAGAVSVAAPAGEGHDGAMFAVLVSEVVEAARPGSDEIETARSDAWAGDRAIAFIGEVRAPDGNLHSELFIVDLPDDVRQPGSKGPLQGTLDQRPAPPAGARQRRLTRTLNRSYPGLQGPRHWPRSTADGSRIAFVMKDDNGIAQLFTIVSSGGDIQQLTDNQWPMTSPFNWHPQGNAICYAMDDSVFVTELDEKSCELRTVRLTDSAAGAPMSTGVVWSNSGKQIAFNRLVDRDDVRHSQIFLVDY